MIFFLLPRKWNKFDSKRERWTCQTFHFFRINCLKCLDFFCLSFQLICNNRKEREKSSSNSEKRRKLEQTCHFQILFQFFASVSSRFSVFFVFDRFAVKLFFNQQIQMKGFLNKVQRRVSGSAPSDPPVNDKPATPPVPVKSATNSSTTSAGGVNSRTEATPKADVALPRRERR